MADTLSSAKRNVNTNKAFDDELAGSNRLVTICVTVECAIIIVAYLAEYLKEARTLTYVIFTCLFCAATPLASWITYGKKKDNGLIKHFVGICFPLFYAYVLFTTENTLTFTYAVPVLIIASAYADSKYSLLESIGFTVLNIGQIIYFLANGIYNSENTAMLEIHLLIVLLIATFAYFTVRRVELNNHKREGRINDEMKRTKELLNHIVEVSRATNTNIDEVHSEITELGSSIRNTSEAMKYVDSGAENTTRTVQNQITYTKNISQKIEQVLENFDEISKNISESLTTIKEGKVTVSALASKSSETIEKGNEVNSKLGKLDAIMTNMNSAVDIISGITSQTSLLALNASIEAARAGEAGRGFSVVASEIQKMAGDTREAADRIQHMVEDVTKAISELVSVTGDMINQIMDQAKATEETVTSFERIEMNTDTIKSCATEMSGAVDQLDDANREIVESISTISSISEEVSVNANSTLISCEENLRTVEKLVEAMNNLSNLASSLAE